MVPHHTFFGFIQHHWLEISMVWFPAFLGYLNAAVASLKVMGFTKAAEILGKLEDGIKTFVDTIKSQGGVNGKTDSGSGTGSGSVGSGSSSNSK